ncbi:hypothetical protein JW930_00070 [Candidatus Woesearchaeota archaeon]|nr:hypothetical protein [Candidatus Woesearchaeota archaeon]
MAIKKKGIMVPSYLVWFIIALIVLVCMVWIWVRFFSGGTRTIDGIQQQTEHDAEESTGFLDDLFGGCEEGETKCNFQRTRVLRCDSEGDWIPQPPCDRETEMCMDGTCVPRGEYEE